MANWEYPNMRAVAQDIWSYFLRRNSLDGPCNTHERENCKPCQKRFHDLEQKLRAFAQRNL